jgi:hypothetical protein
MTCDYKTLPSLSKKYSSGLSFATSGAGDMYGKYAGRGWGVGYTDGIRLAAAERTNARGVEYCLKKSVARASLVSQWSHNTGSIWLKVVSTASSMNYVGEQGRRVLKFLPENHSSVPICKYL